MLQDYIDAVFFDKQLKRKLSKYTLGFPHLTKKSHQGAKVSLKKPTFFTSQLFPQQIFPPKKSLQRSKLWGAAALSDDQLGLWSPQGRGERFLLGEGNSERASETNRKTWVV